MRTIIVFAFLSLMIGCTSMGNRFDANKVNQLQPGVSTVQDAIQSLGPPTSESNFPDGSKLFQWQFVYGTVIGGGGAHAAVLFGSDNRMIRVTALTTTGMESSEAPMNQAMTRSAGHPPLGINGTNISPRTAASLKMAEVRGVFIATVAPGGVADRAGLNQGDVILSFNGTRITDIRSLLLLISGAPTGQPIPLVIWRGGQETSVTVTF